MKSESAIAAPRTAKQQALKLVGILLESQNPEPGDVDGGAIQDWLTKCGFLKETPVTEPCDSENCVCAEFGMPTTCYRWTKLAREARKAANV